MKECPKCKRQWPDRANFCPADGTRLVSAGDAQPSAPAPDKAQPAATPPVAKAASKTSAAPKRPTPGAPSAAPGATGAKPKAPRPDRAASAPHAAGAAVRAEASSPPVEARASAAAKTPAAKAAAAKAPAAKAARKASKKKAAGKPARGGGGAKPAAAPQKSEQGARTRASSKAAGAGQREFSETMWFLRGEDIERKLRELEFVPDEEELEPDTERYVKRKPLPTEVRRRYTLRPESDDDKPKN